MRRLTLGLLCATYLCLSLIVALTLWRNGGGWGAGVAALVGGLGLCLAFHGLIARALENATIKTDVADIREAPAILLSQVEGGGGGGRGGEAGGEGGAAPTNGDPEPAFWLSVLKKKVLK